MAPASSVAARRWLIVGIAALVATLLAVVSFLGGVVVVFGVHSVDILDIDEVAHFAAEPSLPYGSPIAEDSARQVERIPRILHQTWKEDRLPERWQIVSDRCRDMHPD
jgi:hypothetical protein